MSRKAIGVEKDAIGQYTRLVFLTSEQVQMIDDALSSLGDFGEVRLVVEKRVLRFVITQNSIDALKYSAGYFCKRSRRGKGNI